jgi:hypothetical protein
MRRYCSRIVLSVAAFIVNGLFWGLLGIGPLYSSPAAGAAGEVQSAASPPKRANFLRELVSDDARHIADWIVDSGDNHNVPFVIVDKVAAKVYVFDVHGVLRGAAPALLGLAVGDDAVPGIGTRKLSSIRPGERTTQAGRFVAERGHNLRGDTIIWIDYDSGLSLHRVISGKTGEHRLKRLNSPTPLDRRISYGCINVPAKFFDSVVLPSFAGTNGIVYVLPETRPPREVFGSYDVEDHEQQQKVNRAVAPGQVPGGRPY